MVQMKKILKKKKPFPDIPELPSLCCQMYQHLERHEEYPPGPSYLPTLHLSATRGAAKRKRSAQNHLFKLRWRLNSRGCHVPFREVISKFLPDAFHVPDILLDEHSGHGSCCQILAVCRGQRTFPRRAD